MRFMVIVKADETYEAGQQPAEEVFEAMARYNEELVKAGVMLAGEGLLNSAKGAIVRFTDGEPTVIDGPFVEAKELVGGYWVLEVKSREEAVEWVKRVPADPNVRSSIEIRRIVGPEDFGEAFTDDLREREETMRERLEQGR